MSWVHLYYFLGLHWVIKILEVLFLYTKATEDICGKQLRSKNVFSVACSEMKNEQQLY